MGKQPLVIDNGSGITKAGLALPDEKPSLVFPTYVGRPKYKRVLPSSLSESDYFIGAEAESNRGLLRLKYPMSHGIVEDWTDMQNIWRFVYNQLGLRTEEHAVLLTEAPLNPFEHKARAAQIFFQQLQAPCFFIAIQALLSLYASGVSTGVVLDSGDGVTHAVPIYDGQVLSHSITRIDLAGRDVTEYLVTLLRKAGHTFYTSAQFEVVKQIKERNCYVSTFQTTEDRFLDDASKNVNKHYLPDGSQVTLGPEKSKAAEILFSPDKVGIGCMGVQECLINSIHKSDIEMRKVLYSNIYLAGGTTMIPGFGERLFADLRKMSPKEMKIKITPPPERRLSCWLGGSAVAQLSSFASMWITKAEYEEQGSRVLHVKAF